MAKKQEKPLIDVGYEKYRTKGRLIKEMIDEFNNELGLKAESQIKCTPDNFIIPIVHKDNKKAEHVCGAFMSDKQDTLKARVKFNKEDDAQLIPIKNIIISLLKYGSEFDSDEPQLIKKCLEKYAGDFKE